MVRYENECCGCASPLYPCRGDICSLRHVPHLYCDDCKNEVEEGELFHYEGEELCIECIEERLEKVKVEDSYD